MALFGSKKKKEAPKEETKVKTKPAVVKKLSTKKVADKAPASPRLASLGLVLIQPRITEKATMQAEKGIYVFEVNPNTTKKEIISAIKKYYNVTPSKVNTIKIPSKKVSSRTRGRYGIKSGGKKAYVYLKKGDKIEIV